MLKIDRFTAEYRIPQSHPDAQGLKDNLDGLVRGDLTRALRARLERNEALRDESIWLIRGIRAEIEIDARLDPERIAERWAEAIAREFERAVGEPELSANVVRFASEADLIARYVLELAFGSATGKWYLRRFDGLGVLQPSFAIRTVLTDNPQFGMDAATTLSSREWVSIATALTEGDAARILRAWAAVSSEEPAPERMWQIWKQEAFAAPAATQESRTAVRLAVAALRENRHASTAASAVALTRFACLSRELNVTQADRLIGLLARAEIARLYAIVGAGNAEALRALTGAPETLLQEVSSAVRGGSADRGMTQFGGIFLLLPLMAEMPFSEMAAVLGNGDPAMLRFLTAMKCFGCARAGEFLSDPMMAYLLGVQKPISSDGIRKYLKRCTRGIGRAGAVLNDWLHRQDYVSGWTVTIGVPERRLQVTADLARGIWMAISVSEPRASASGIPNTDTDMQMRRLSLAAAELDYLDFPANLEASARTNLFFSRVANVLLRNLSWRLPGFHASSIPYLAANFLDMHANLEREDATLRAQLSKPPLHVVLSVAGMMQREFKLPWIEDCRISLSAEAS